MGLPGVEVVVATTDLPEYFLRENKIPVCCDKKGETALLCSQ